MVQGDIQLVRIMFIEPRDNGNDNDADNQNGQWRAGDIQLARIMFDEPRDKKRDSPIIRRECLHVHGFYKWSIHCN